MNDDSLPPPQLSPERIVRPLPSIAEWPGVAAEILRIAIAKHPLYRTAADDLKLTPKNPTPTNWQGVNMLQHIRGVLPTHLFSETPPEDWDGDLNAWLFKVQLSQAVWFSECSKAFGFQRAKKALKSKQLSLFDEQD